MSKQERWIQDRWIVVSQCKSETLAVIMTDYSSAEKEAKEEATLYGEPVYIARAIAIVHPPKKAEATVERLPGAPRKRRVMGADTVLREAQASVALDKGDGETHSVDDDGVGAQVLTLDKVVPAMYAIEVDREIMALLPPCPACDAGGAPVKGRHTNMETGKRYPCPRAKAQKGDA